MLDVVALVGFIITLRRRREVFAAVVRFVGGAGRRLCGRWLHHSGSPAHLVCFFLRAKGLHESAKACVIESRWRSMRNTVSANHAKSPGKQSNLSIDESQILEAWRGEAHRMLNTCLLHTNSTGRLE